ncbi:tRNA lysidine(34) synthetase TilS [Helicobacter sp. MIT 14-3879]|uniref:tRNA lysidine(34) synthetase TilS n=1 Tax=Helicobacter sp. MIT 14-3879 TaxID=2040649 RepID=UPI000E1E53B4|nr:tRNA lysidine(34) synthetase TilS [Helicobacter sp. MIT 14-3879]RDU65567.1 tRNA lysidine(34) synthetase TilS [Helicobacter sp. MIT 14-3879]
MKSMRNKSDKITLLHLPYLQDKRNLLGFSGGADSTCLFHLLLKNGIYFDIAMVNYNLRKESKDEIRYAKKLAKKYNKKIFILKAKKIKNNFESRAREIRYDFFKKIINSYNYDNLVLANQLNDRIEWLLMQLSKGCGLNSLLGFDSLIKANSFNIIRPFSETSRDKIEHYLKKHKIKYFIDKSNKDIKYKRNYFRKNYASNLVRNYSSGLLKSLSFLKEDFLALYGGVMIREITNSVYRIFVFKKRLDLENLHNIDICAKKLGYVISQKQREEILKSLYSCVIGDKIIIDCNKNEIFICENLSKQKQNLKNPEESQLKKTQKLKKAQSPQKHNKKFRDILRLASIPPKIRPYITKELLDKFKNF